MFGDTLHYLRQEHPSPILMKDDEYERGVIESQQSVLDKLLELQPKDVFYEGLFEDYPAGYKPEKNSNTRRIFDNYIPGGELNAEQKKRLFTFGAAVVYYRLHDDVTLHAANSREQMERTDRYFEKEKVLERLQSSGMKTINENDKREIVTVREEDVAKKIAAFFSANSGKEAALVYGWKHDFSPYFENVKIFDHDCVSKKTRQNPVTFDLYKTQTGQEGNSFTLPRERTHTSVPQLEQGLMPESEDTYEQPPKPGHTKWCRCM